MAPRKTERILNLTICLLVTRQYLPKSRIREIVEGYHGLSDAAFERTFERDKDELRRLGIDVQVGTWDAYFDDEQGYRIERSAFELPPIELDAEEAAVVGVAARAWQHVSLASSTRSALAKLRAAGVEPDTGQLAGLEPSLAANEPAFEPLWRAVLDRERVSFTYRSGETRTLEPWGITSFHGHWYVVGHDTDRDATRMFRLSRMRDVPRAVSKPGAFAVPDDLDLRALARALRPDEPTARALLALRAGKVPTLRRGGEPATPSSADGPHFPVPEGFDLVSVGYADLHTLAEDVARYAADVVVVAPAELRDAVVARLRAVAATHSAGPDAGAAATAGVTGRAGGTDAAPDPMSVPAGATR
ncbi:proteasome accessory factor B [Friedmanniella endophytica]|uniref:Proteasome accessory factor B n=1 Tax=Microlunatus kandeliicorticis TaxID=1759536 RepID=A0A7W3IU19_9ACTN|nr:WYL domain-containing protein [Microlunatus kandeliicorticis]MBA8795251.1 proteasome accessory factor B [Microlunatus kandeliicorticis]